jgi:hypothetical protein
VNSKLRKFAASAALAMALGTVPVALVAAPAAAASCTNASWDAWGSGYATANCVGPGQVRFKVTCQAVWPWTPWTSYGAWHSPGGGQTIVSVFPTCSNWASYSFSLQYR